MAKNFVTIDCVSRRFELPSGGSYVALKDIDLSIDEGEFISLIGHSGCGKSTLLNLLAGLDQATSGGILMEGRQVTEPGPERMMVFQNYSLLPWQTVRQNIALAVNNVMRDATKKARQQRIKDSIELVGLSHACDKFPGELSGGMRQRVAIARALSIQPKLLLLDEPFGALDALTRGNLQQQLMQICQRAGVTTVMVTHSVDEALLLSDRVVCLSNGPQAGIGQIIRVDLPRPRQQLDVIEHPHYYQLRSELIGFLQQQRRLKKRRQISAPAPATAAIASAALPGASVSLRVGYLAGLDIAPLAMGIDRTLFAQQNLKLVPTSFADWEVLEERLRAGDLELAITSATAPLALNLGLGGRSPWPAITPMTVTRNGNAIALARRFLERGVRNLADLAGQLPRQVTPLRLAIGQVSSMQDLLLRHWLASGGIHPDRDLTLVPMSPMAMQAALQAGEIDGFIAGRYRVAKAVEADLAFVLATDLDIWGGHPEKVITCHEGWAAASASTLVRFCAALIQAAQLCEDARQHDSIVGLLSHQEWLGRGAAMAMERQFTLGERPATPERMPLPRFHSDRAHVVNPAEGAWILSQFSRWGWSSFPSNRLELLSQVYRQEICDQALVRAGCAALRAERRPFPLADGQTFDQDDPLAYLKALPFSSAVRLEPAPLAEISAHPSRTGP